MKKKALRIFVLFALSFVTLTAARARDNARLLSETQASGACGSGMTWRLDVDGVMTISGKGAMADYPTPNVVPWRKRRWDIEKVNVQYGVTRIGKNAFSECPNLLALTLPETLRVIGESAFAQCESLSDFVIADGLREIGNLAFSECSGMDSFPTPKTVMEIGQSAFSHCVGLTEFDLTHTALTETRTYLFSGCTSLKTVKLPDTVRTIGQRTFSGCTSLTEFEFPERTSTIGPYAFEGCTSLRTVAIPPRIVELESGTFSDCAGLQSVEIPESVKNVKQMAFYNCNGLRDVYYAGTATQWTTISMTDFREQIDRRMIAVHYGQAERESDVVIESINVENGRVTAHITGNPDAGSTLLIASYDADGRFLGAESYPIDDPNAYTVFTPNAHTLTAFLMDSRNRPSASALSKEVN